MAGVVTKDIEVPSGGPNGFTGGFSDRNAAKATQDRYYVMESYNWTPSPLNRPVGKYDTQGDPFDPSSIKTTRNMAVFTPLKLEPSSRIVNWGFVDQKGAVFKTIVDNASDVPNSLTVGVALDVNPKELTGFHSEAFNENQLYISKGTSQAILSAGFSTFEDLGFNQRLDSRSGLNNLDASKSMFRKRSASEGLQPGKGYSDIAITFKPGNNGWSSKVNLNPVTISFYEKVPLEIIGDLVDMLDWEDPKNTSFAGLTPQSRFEDGYKNFLNSVGKFIVESIPFAIVKAIDRALGEETPDFQFVPLSTHGYHFEDKDKKFLGIFGGGVQLKTKYFKLNPLNRTIKDDLRQVADYASKGPNNGGISQDLAKEYTDNLNEEAKILRTVRGKIANDLEKIIKIDDPTFEGNKDKGNVFGDFCFSFKALMDRLYEGTTKIPPRKGVDPKGKEAKPKPSTILGQQDNEEDVAAAFADNQIKRIKVNNVNFFGAHEAFTQPMSVLDIIRDETEYPKSDNVTNVFDKELPDDLDLCGEYFKNLDIQTMLDTISLLRLQLCGNIGKISTQMGKLKRIQFSQDFKLMSLFTGFKGISFENFGLPNFGNFNLPDFSLPNFGVPNLSLSDFGIPNIGLDLLTNLEIPNITLPNIDFPDINIPGIGGINIPKFQGFNFDWDDPLKNVNEAKDKIRGLSWPDLNLKVKLPKINWDPDFNLSALKSFSIPIDCDLPVNIDIPVPKLSASAEFPCSLISDIKKIIENPQVVMNKMENAKKSATNTLKKYEAKVDEIKGLVEENADIAKKIEIIQKSILEKQSEVQSQVAGQVIATTNSVKNQIGNVVNNVPTLGNAQIERGRASLAEITGGVDSSSVVDTLKARLEV